MLKSLRSRVLILVLVLSGMTVAVRPGLAQDAPPAPPPQTEPAPAAAAPAPIQPSPAVSAALADATRELDGVKAALDPIEAQLTREDLSEAELGEVRNRLEPVRNQLEGVIARLQPQVDTANRRLSELGAAPGAGATEGAETALERTAQNADFKAIDEVMRRARLLLVEVIQASDTAGERRRSKFTNELFARHSSLLSPELWMSTVSGLSRDITSASFILRDAATRVKDRMTPGNGAIMGVVLLAAIILWGPGRKWANAMGARYAVQQVPAHRLRRSAHAVWVLFVTLIAPTVAAFTVLYGLRVSQMLTPRLEPLAITLVFAVAFVTFVDGLAKGILSPNKASWRLPAMSDDLAQGIRVQARLVALVYVLGLIISSVNLVVVTRPEATLVTDGLFALANAITFAIALKVLRVSDADGDDASSEPEAHPVLGLFRIVVWGAIAAIIVSLLVGYIAFAKFLAHQVIGITIIGALLYLFSALIDDLFTIGFSGGGAMCRWIHGTIGLKRSSVELIGILLSGFFRLVIYGMAVLAILAPWGIGSYDAFGWMRALAFGFSIGSFRVSISAILLAVFILFIGVFITRALQSWLETRLLPKTQIEPGLQNSIRTGIGYLGVILASVFALGTVGLNLQNVAIVAGALSVGIGFGLQSIVNNFVSGLILLAERPVKVGDWVELGTSEGNIRKISVRATEIELFDRSTLIVPNSELISKAVVNKTHANPLGRVKITFMVPADSNLGLVRSALMDSASAHVEVMEDPGPSVILGTIGPATLELTLLAFVATPRRAASVKSELQFDIVRRFHDEKIVLPVAAPNEQAESIKDIAKAIEHLSNRLDGLSSAGRRVSSPKES
jgi:small-conductance mechanosensitive channel